MMCISRSDAVAVEAHADRLLADFSLISSMGCSLIDINIYVYIIYVYFNCIIASYRPHNNRKFILVKNVNFLLRNVK